MIDPAALSTAARRVVNTLAGHARGLTAAELTDTVRRLIPGLAVARVEVLLREAARASAVREDRGRWYAVQADASSVPDAAERGEAGGLMRAVIVDVESVVRPTAVEPYTDQRIYQIGAVRAGADAAWVKAEAPLSVWVELPEYEGWEITSDQVRAAHTAGALAAAAALSMLTDFAEGADAIVAYNGIGADFPMLDKAFAREGLPALGGQRIDAYYLALAVWPAAPSHRLASIAEFAGADVEGLALHDAADDCVLLGRVLDAAAVAVAAWPEDLAGLVASVVPDSPGWMLLKQLARRGTTVGRPALHGHGQAAAVVQTLLAGRATVRGPAAGSGRGPVVTPSGLRGTDGRVDPVALAAVVRGGDARPRPAQQQMTAALHRWADDGAAALIEAPTGTGKSFAVLAAALDYLAADPRRTVVVSTFTKQLQAQLAQDVAALERAAPGLIDVCDVVKGAANRLSLRALLVTLADATAPAGPAARLGAAGRFVDRLGFRELLVFLLLRLVAIGSKMQTWQARSVDPADVPAFFSDYFGPVLPVWLATLSQGTARDYDPASPQAIGDYTSGVAEALAGHRLILANHALLLAHLDDLAALGPDVMVVVDEAHALEDAATSALTVALDYRALEDLSADLGVWSAEHPEMREAADAVGNLGRLLDQEQLPRTASLAFDARSGGAGGNVGGRTVTLASPFAGTSGVREVRQLAAQLKKIAGLCDAIIGALGAHLAAAASGMDFFAVERIRTLIARTASTGASAATLVANMDELLAPPASPAGIAPAAPGRITATNGTVVGGMPAEEGVDRDELSGAEPEDPARAVADSDAAEHAGPPMADSDGAGELVLAPPPDSAGQGNHVVFAEEENLPVRGLRNYRFQIAAAPIELPAEPAWQRFIAAFARTYYVSATLQVAGRWEFIRDRLGLGTSVAELTLDSPFDLAAQARLVCFSDFPSWAEQADGAMRTVAHQLAGYTAAMISAARPAGMQGHEGRGGFDGGAMVLTTSRSAAGGIADYLAGALRRAGSEVPVHSALVLGNQRAISAYSDTGSGGGLLVGTRGLWQGVDVADPARLRLVWINKLPFAPFAAPVIEARRAAVAARAEQAHAEDPEAAATEAYYIPLAALGLRQAVGRLIRSERHLGIVVISDRKLSGATALRRTYRRAFLGSLDPGLLLPDPDTGEAAGGNVVPMAEGWRRIWEFYAQAGLLDPDRAEELCTPEALAEHTLLPQTRAIKVLALTDAETDDLTEAAALADEVVERATRIGGLLHLSDEPAVLKPSQEAVIRAVAEGRNVLGLLPTGFGKSFCFQLPALVLPGVTIVVSPLVALMQDQALELNRSIGGAVRALVAPLRESSSRAGKTEVAEQLLDRAEHGIRLVYTSPERLCQRRFREVVRQAVSNGQVRRIVLDEAHTFVAWGDDFRPAFRRVERFLAELRAEFGLPVTALTATANQTVRAGLREGVFGLPPEPPADGDGDALITITENPIRPEIGIFRRTVRNSGPVAIAGLAEEVLSEVHDHSIFYCLTVKEVTALHAQLRELFGEAGIRVRRFHGRLTEAEKAAVLSEFREAPRRGEEGFVPLVVVATSAFGLGINRPDIRTVFCVSPPTDLAALYQQIGRAGRDAAAGSTAGATDPAEDGTTAAIPAGTDTAANNTEASSGGVAEQEPPTTVSHPGSALQPANTGLTLCSTRSLRTVAFMTGQDLPVPVLRRMGTLVLRCDGVLDAEQIAEDLIGENVAAGFLSAEAARERRTTESYTAGVMRALATLAMLGAVEDLGDFPPKARILPGEIHGRDDDPLEEDVVAALLDLPMEPEHPIQLGRRVLQVARADEHLARHVPGYRDAMPDAAATWQLLAELHDRGRLDVSAAPSRRLVTGVAARTDRIPDGFDAAMAGKAVRAAREVALLRDFFTDLKTCANEKFASYFDVLELPPDCCSTAANRCSACWEFRPDIPLGERPPAVAEALAKARPRPISTGIQTAAGQRRLDAQVLGLLWAVERGLSAYDIHRALRGQDSWFYAAKRRYVRLPASVTNSRLFGAAPTLKEDQVLAALTRLTDTGKIVTDGPRWRDVGNVARQQRRQARRAAAASEVVS